jgi:hypothetical protein
VTLCLCLFFPRLFRKKKEEELKSGERERLTAIVAHRKKQANKQTNKQTKQNKTKQND